MTTSQRQRECQELPRSCIHAGHAEIMTHSQDMAQSPAHVVIGDWSGPVVATAIHAGHELRTAVADAMKLDEEVRFREEDPFTDRIAHHVPRPH
ncbi:N-formylglutamate amidohydrolase [Pseudoclavibacter albus]|uniref:N-formylglutamate amidohydrolase n=1 Tax=Pseudoclavibacter albus TaxID=272241 RepID=UPI000B1CA2B4|nr:N-formylglutamate amidohydrolase [Pseudoclavibacter alba]